MQMNRLLVGAVLAIAIGAPIAAFVQEKNEQPMTSTGVPVPFLHGFPLAQAAVKPSWLRSSARMNG